MIQNVKLNNEKHVCFFGDCWTCICQYLDAKTVGRLMCCNSSFAICPRELFKPFYSRKAANTGELNYILNCLNCHCYDCNLETKVYFKYFLNNCSSDLEKIKDAIFSKVFTEDYKLKDNGIYFLSSLIKLLSKFDDYDKITDYCFFWMKHIFNSEICDIYEADNVKNLFLYLLITKKFITQSHQDSIFNVLSNLLKIDFNIGMNVIFYFVIYNNLSDCVKRNLFGLLNLYIFGKCKNENYTDECIFYAIKLGKCSDEILKVYLKFLKKCLNDGYWRFLIVKTILSHRTNLKKEQQLELFYIIKKLRKINLPDVLRSMKEDFIKNSFIKNEVREKALKFVNNNPNFL